MFILVLMSEVGSCFSIGCPDPHRDSTGMNAFAFHCRQGLRVRVAAPTKYTPVKLACDVVCRQHRAEDFVW